MGTVPEVSKIIKRKCIVIRQDRNGLIFDDVKQVGFHYSRYTDFLSFQWMVVDRCLHVQVGIPSTGTSADQI